MNWEALGSIAELLGALGVIGSFFYLALQIRQNTDPLGESIKSQQIATYQAVQDSGHQVRGQVQEHAALYLKGLRDPPALAPEELLIFNTLMEGVISYLRELCLYNQLGTLDAYLWRIQEDLIRWLASHPEACEPLSRTWLIRQSLELC